MFEAAMVENHIHHNLQTFLVSLIYQLLIIGIGSETWVYTIIIGGSISMITAVLAVTWTVVLQNRGKPQSGYTQLVKIIQVLADSLQVATMAQTRLCTVAGLITHRLKGIILQIAVGETVWHQHIEHIFIRETDALIARHLTVLQHILHLLRLFALLEVEGHLTSLCPIEVKINQEIIRRIKAGDAVYLHTRIVYRYIGILDILAIHHQLE